MTKQYNTLRPFNTETASRGDTFFSTFHHDVVTYVAGPDKTGCVCCEYREQLMFIGKSQSKQNPICWVEDKPVYKGNTLHYLSPLSPKFAGNFQIKDTGYTTNEVFLEGGGWVYIKDLTWVLAKTKHEGWINVYPNKRVHNDIHATKEIADKIAFEHRIDCIKIEWME